MIRASDITSACASHIAQHGFVKVDVWKGKTGCTVGLIEHYTHKAAGGSRRELAKLMYERERVLDVLDRVIARQWGWPNGRAANYPIRLLRIMMWNDRPGRTAGDLLLAFRTATDLLRIAEAAQVITQPEETTCEKSVCVPLTKMHFAQPTAKSSTMTAPHSSRLARIKDYLLTKLTA